MKIAKAGEERAIATHKATATDLINKQLKALKIKLETTT